MHSPDIAFEARSGAFAAHAPGSGSSDGEGQRTTNNATAACLTQLYVLAAILWKVDHHFMMYVGLNTFQKAEER